MPANKLKRNSVDLEASTRKLKLGGPALETQPGQLTPSFFNSIFNDGMNPFDESFISNQFSNAIANSSSPLNLRGRNDNKFRVEQPSIEQSTYSHVNADLQALKRRQTLQSSEPSSPMIFSSNVPSNNNNNNNNKSRSPSPLPVFNHFSPVPSASISPITSPEDLSGHNSESPEQKAVFRAMEGVTYLPGTDENTTGVPTINDTKDSLASYGQNMNFRRATVQPTATGMNVQNQNSRSASEESQNQGQPQVPSIHDGRCSSFSEMFPPSGARLTFFDQLTSTNVSKAPSRRRKSAMTAAETAKIKSEEDALGFKEVFPINAPAAKKRKESFKAPVEKNDVDNNNDDDEDDDDDMDDGSVEKEGKRARFLERNRIAASKCRKKKKLMNARLEEKSRVLQTENRFLNIEKEQLKADICKLKQIVLLHHSCSCEGTQNYLKHEAGKFLDEVNAERDVNPSTVEPTLEGKNASLENKAKLKNDPNWSNQILRHQVFGGEFHSFEELENAVLPRPNTLMDINDEDFAIMFDHIAR